MGFLLYTFDCDLLVMANAVGNYGRSWLDLRWENGITPNKYSVYSYLFHTSLVLHRVIQCLPQYETHLMYFFVF